MTDSASQDWPVLVLETTSTEDLHVELVPELGAKITSIRLGPGREWLAPPVRPLAHLARQDQDWVELDCSGWDECFPNVASCVALGLLDHGEAWRRPWSVRKIDDGICTELTGDGFLLRRTLRVSGHRLVVDYLLRSSGRARLDWAWAQHALLAADEDTRLVLSEPTQVRVESAFMHGKLSADRDWLCPSGVLGTETELGAAQGRAAKLWFRRPLPTAVGVRCGDEWLLWRLLDTSVPDLGLWINLGGWGESSLAHVAVEPAFGSSDDPEVAYRQGAADGGWSLRRGATRRWRVVIEAGKGREALGQAMVTPPRL